MVRDALDAGVPSCFEPFLVLLFVGVLVSSGIGEGAEVMAAPLASVEVLFFLPISVGFNGTILS